ncbi:hypothetical protein RIR_jg2402.t1 [Rhizophagus irregularis DAOM 181602=DAOM 197198]|nr:hypothetical protein RIR_jg2402.t1 [Rhizophagus irregularis DAOM 181602=DAOM 197198]CAG8685339.1 14010_t:CDS:2 [Rhizophagus irregularis]
MPENLVWCTCQIYSLEKEGSSWESKIARTRHRQRDRRNIQGPNDLQDDHIQNPNLNIYGLEESIEFVSNLVEESMETIEEFDWYYLTYEFEGSKVMLAYIQWTSPVNDEDDVSVKTLDE